MHIDRQDRIGRSIVAELDCISWNASHTVSLKLRSYLRRRKRKIRGRNVLPRRYNVCRNVTSSWKALLFRGDFRGELPGNCATKMQLDAPAGRPRSTADRQSGLHAFTIVLLRGINQTE